MNAPGLTKKVIEALDDAGIPYMLVGSFSSNYYGIPRSTEDADFVLQVEPARLQSLTDRLGPDFVCDPQLSFETNTGTFKCLLWHRDTSFKVELFMLSQDAHDQERWRRRKIVTNLERQVCLPSPEDVIITKLRWFRSKDLEDVKDVVGVQGNRLDWPYIESWCAKHGTLSRLATVRETVPVI
jgi:hypothetical protein